MYNNVYEDYIRSIIGRGTDNSRNDYMNCGNNIFDDNLYQNELYENYEFGNNIMNYSQNTHFMNATDDFNLEECYPELYRLLYPMIQKVCMKCTRSLSKDVIDEMVEEVYSNFSGDEGETTQININLANDVRSSKTNTSVSNNSTATKAVSSSTATTKLDRSLEKRPEEKRENRQVRQRNPVLNDLIRILILRELLGRPGGIFRPPFGRPPQHPRPPHNRPNNMPNFPNFPNRPNQGRPRENRLNLNLSQQDIYNSYPSEMFEDGYNIF